MGSIAESQRNAMLDALVGRASYNANAAVWVKLHTGDPGDSGTDNPATETTRQQALFASAAAGGEISNTNELTWDNIAATGVELITHVSLWDASSGGTFLGRDAAPGGKEVESGDSLILGVGAIKLKIRNP